MKIFAIIICLLFISVPFAAYSQDNRLKGLDAFIEQAMKDYGVPGASVVVVKDNDIVYLKGFGLRKIDSNLKVDENTIFQLASVTKTFTAASVGIAVDRGNMEFDEQVIDIMLRFALHDPYPTRYTTPRDLLSHRTGLPAFTGDLFDHLGYTREEVVRRIRFIEPACSFRDEANYSNLGFFLAGETAANSTGSTWESLVRTSILSPLGMNRSGFTDSIDKQSNAAFPHGVIEGETRVVPYNKQSVLAPRGRHDVQCFGYGALHDYAIRPREVFGQADTLSQNSRRDIHPCHGCYARVFRAPANIRRDGFQLWTRLGYLSLEKP